MIEQWTEMPTGWIHAGGLKQFRWEDGSGATAALMLYIALILNCQKLESVDEESELPDGVRFLQDRLAVSYDELQAMTALSRAKVAEGLRKLVTTELVSIDRGHPSVFRVSNYGATPWAKLPKRHIYRGGGMKMRAFSLFTLRSRRELDAAKLYFLLLAFRDNKQNCTYIGYEKISDYAGIRGNDIRKAASLLIVNNLINTDRNSEHDREQHAPTQYFVIGIEQTRAYRSADLAYQD